MAIKGLKTFNQKLTRFAKVEVPHLATVFYKGIAMRLLRGVVLKTPVDTGRLRAAWVVGINEIPSGSVEKTDKDGKPTIQKGAKKLNEFTNKDLGKTIYIVNNVEYASYIEEGTDKIKPHKMLALTIQELSSMFKKG